MRISIAFCILVWCSSSAYATREAEYLAPIEPTLPISLQSIFEDGVISRMPVDEAVVRLRLWRYGWSEPPYMPLTSTEPRWEIDYAGSIKALDAQPPQIGIPRLCPLYAPLKIDCDPQ